MRRLGARGLVGLVLHPLFGWGVCGAIMDYGRAVSTLDATLVVHAVAAPLVFAALALAYARWFPHPSPLATAAAFTAVVILLDAALVAPVFERSFAMFESPAGTWVPFASIFLATWLSSHAAGALPHRPAPAGGA